jgi:hypothetical protein
MILSVFCVGPGNPRSLGTISTIAAEPQSMQFNRRERKERRDGSLLFVILVIFAVMFLFYEVLYE